MSVGMSATERTTTERTTTERAERTETSRGGNVGTVTRATGYRPGDLLLFVGRPESRLDRIVCSATHGPFCHAEVAVTETESIGAIGQGVVRHPIPAFAHVAAPTSRRCDPARLPEALAWLEARVGDGYSVLDLAADALKVYLPAWLGSRTPFLVAPSAFDCSHLAATFLAMAGYPLPPALVADLARTSPNDLARAVGLL